MYSKSVLLPVSALALLWAGCAVTQNAERMHLRTVDAKVETIATGNQEERSEAIKFLAGWLHDGTEEQKHAIHFYNRDSEPLSDHKPGYKVRGRVLLLAVPNLIEELKGPNRKNAAVVLARLTHQENKAHNLSLRVWGDWWLREGHYEYASQAFQ